MGLQSTKLVDILVQCSLRQMLENGFFHADPHAGNLLAMSDGKLCYLDFGMMSYVEPSQRYSIIEAVVHMVNRDFVALANLYKRMGFIPK
jgi:predicted unusual protein kinase regulating ubiquinone biosynthesis (AarF/ABC1/UbiB family)